MEDSTNVNEFENTGPNGDSSQTLMNCASGLDRAKITLKSFCRGPSPNWIHQHMCKVTKINTRRGRLEGNTTGLQKYVSKLGDCMKFHQRN
jgi:hypothetical protein